VTKRSLRRELKRQAGSAAAFHRAWQTEQQLSNSLFAQLSEAHREITALKEATPRSDPGHDVVGDPRYYGLHRMLAVLAYNDPAQWFERRTSPAPDRTRVDLHPRRWRQTP
jgi:hypothetical protein